MPRSASRLWPPCVLRHAPVDTVEKVAQLRRLDCHDSIGWRWPDKVAPFQALGKQAHALAVIPQDLDQSAAATAEHEQMAIVRIVLECLLNLQRQAIEAAPHVCVAARQPDPRTTWDRDHRRRRLARVRSEP